MTILPTAYLAAGGIRLRSFHLILAASTLLLVLPLPLAAAEENFGCHSWEVFVGERNGIGAGLSPEDGALYAGDGRFYVVSDGDPVRNPWIFSIWIYEETGEMPGLQRGDEVCNEYDWPYADTGCFC